MVNDELQQSESNVILPESLQREIDRLINIIAQDENFNLQNERDLVLYEELKAAKINLNNLTEIDEDAATDFKFLIAHTKAAIQNKRSFKEKEAAIIGLFSGLIDKIAKAFDDHRDSKVQEKLFQKIYDAQEQLLSPSEERIELILQKAEFEAKNVEAKIMKKERERKHLRRFGPGVIFFYISIIFAVIIASNFLQWNEFTKIPLLSVPVSVILWASIGSLAAILYRFYTKNAESLEDELKWLLARPIIGIIMGCIGYIAIIGGLIVFGTSPPLIETYSSQAYNNSETVNSDSVSDGNIAPESSEKEDKNSVNDKDARVYMFWIVAFLCGYSDKFFESTIELLAGKLSTKSKEATIVAKAKKEVDA